MKIKSPDPPDFTSVLNIPGFANSLSIFPNPANNIFMLQYRSDQAGNLSFIVKDALGNTFYKKSLSNFSGELNETIDLSGYSKGIYFLEIQSSRPAKPAS